MRRRSPRSTRTDALVPCATLFRSSPPPVRVVGSPWARYIINLRKARDVPENASIARPWHGCGKSLELQFLIVKNKVTRYCRAGLYIGAFEAISVVMNNMRPYTQALDRQIGRASCRERVCQYV